MSEVINNSQKRVEELARIIRELHAGEDPDAVKVKLSELVRKTTSEEIVAMEQQLISEGMSVDEIKEMCDLHSQVTREILDAPADVPLAPGHPVHTFRLENRAVANVVTELRGVLAGFDGTNLASTLSRCRELHASLMEVEKHYARKENILFPYLERHGVTGPSQVMWGKDDDIRVLMKSFREALTSEKASGEEWRLVFQEIAVPMLDQIDEMIGKEERILFPMSLNVLTREEWGQIYRESPRFGTCLVTPGTDYEPVHAPESSVQNGGNQRVSIGTGSLTPEQLQGIASVLPVDLTFVDADDRVAFFTEGPDRIFARAPAIIGRKVQNCHPPQSVEVVERILSDFRSGRENVAEFWIELRQRFVHIRYFAVRDQRGEYLGTLEVTQDLTRPRSLTGERRLLQYEDVRTG